MKQNRGLGVRRSYTMTEGDRARLAAIAGMTAGGNESAVVRALIRIATLPMVRVGLGVHDANRSG